MKLHVLMTLCAAASLAAVTARAAGETGLPYLKRPAITAADMAIEVSSDPQLLARYSKHFHAAPAAVTAAIRTSTAITLPAGTYTVWLTGRNGLRYPTVQDRAKPTAALAIILAPGAEPAWLESGTGNPMALFRPVEQIVVVEAPAPAPDRVEEVETPKEVLVAAGK